MFRSIRPLPPVFAVKPVNFKPLSVPLKIRVIPSNPSESIRQRQLSFIRGATPVITFPTRKEMNMTETVRPKTGEKTLVTTILFLAVFAVFWYF